VLKPSDRRQIRLDQGRFVLLFKAFFAELEHKFT